MVICSSSSSNSNPPLKLKSRPEVRFQPLSLKNMGCITSKVVSKSISFKEELNITLQRRSNSISSIQELIISSNNKTDQLLNLLCSPNLETQTQTQTQNPKPDIIDDVDDLARRSKSCQWFPEHEPSPNHISDETIEQEPSASKNPRRRARSIHTVEEYDAILENLWLSRDSDKNSPTGEESSKSTEEAIELQEKGLKRKAVAKGLESLTLPQTIEFQKVDSLKDWLQVGAGAGAYVTPRFGSYAVPCAASESRGSESAGFNPELVAAFEECMLQLQEEEDFVLKHIADHLEEGEGDEGVPSLSKDIDVQN